jgi:trk system potassium uptake protein TrkA
MKTVIVGCGRVGAVLAEQFDAGGHDVVVIDLSTRAFDRLSSAFRGTAVRGDGTDEDTLRRAGAEEADLFLALTEGDNRNVMAAQLAHEALRARSVIAKINDPVRAKAYADLGIATLCRTNLMADAVNRFVGLPESGEPGIMAPTGSHPGGDHHVTGDPELASATPVTPSPVGGGVAAPFPNVRSSNDPAGGPAADRSLEG